MSKRKLTEKKSGDEISSWDWDTLNQTLYKINRIIDLLPVYIKRQDEAHLSETSSVQIMEWLYLVDMTWDDTTPHFFNIPVLSSVWQSPAVIQKDQPSTGHKRAFEDYPTGYDYIHGWYLATGMVMAGKFEIDARIGAFHGHGDDAFRARIGIVIADPRTLDVIVRNDTVPWVWINFSMLGLGYPNGSYDKPLSGYIIFTDPPTYSFYPANPHLINYNMISNITGTSCNILYGYEDNWEADWDKWASINRYARFRNVPATKPPEVEVIKDMPLKNARATIAKWDGEYRLWVRNGERGMIMNLGSNIKIEDYTYKDKSDINLKDYDKTIKVHTEQTLSGRLHTLKVKTNLISKHEPKDTWILKIFEHKNINIIFGDETWDGDKRGYCIATFP